MSYDDGFFNVFLLLFFPIAGAKQVMPLFGSFSRARPPIEEQLETLVRLGISPNEHFSLGDAVAALGRQSYERKPYLMLLCVLGGETEKAPHQPRSSHIWHLDTECIEDHGDYVRVAKRMSLLAGSDLAIENLEDHVDIEEGRASLSFSLNGEKINWSPVVNHDWIDPIILSNFVKLLDQQKTTRRYTYLDLRGQDCLVGCATAEQLALLRKATGLNFEWLR